MAKIPTFRPQVQTGALNAGRLRGGPSADDLGAGVGRQIASLGEGFAKIAAKEQAKSDHSTGLKAQNDYEDAVDVMNAEIANIPDGTDNARYNELEAEHRENFETERMRIRDQLPERMRDGFTEGFERPRTREVDRDVMDRSEKRNETFTTQQFQISQKRLTDRLLRNPSPSTFDSVLSARVRGVAQFATAKEMTVEAANTLYDEARVNDILTAVDTQLKIGRTDWAEQTLTEEMRDLLPEDKLVLLDQRIKDSKFNAQVVTLTSELASALGPMDSTLDVAGARSLGEETILDLAPEPGPLREALQQSLDDIVKDGDRKVKAEIERNTIRATQQLEELAKNPFIGQTEGRQFINQFNTAGDQEIYEAMVGAYERIFGLAKVTNASRIETASIQELIFNGDPLVSDSDGNSDIAKITMLADRRHLHGTQLTSLLNDAKEVRENGLDMFSKNSTIKAEFDIQMGDGGFEWDDLTPALQNDLIKRIHAEERGVHQRPLIPPEMATIMFEMRLGGASDSILERRFNDETIQDLDIDLEDIPGEFKSDIEGLGLTDEEIVDMYTNSVISNRDAYGWSQEQLNEFNRGVTFLKSEMRTEPAELLMHSIEGDGQVQKALNGELDRENLGPMRQVMFDLHGRLGEDNEELQAREKSYSTNNVPEPEMIIFDEGVFTIDDVALDLFAEFKTKGELRSEWAGYNHASKWDPRWVEALEAYFDWSNEEISATTDQLPAKPKKRRPGDGRGKPVKGRR